MSTDTKLLGNQAEEFVTKELIKQGFTIQERNYRKLYGEVDIIAQKKDLLAFVEVKLRSSNYIPMQEIISASKQHKIGLVAREYIAAHNVDNLVCRFDVALIAHQQGTFVLTYIPHAFECSY